MRQQGSPSSGVGRQHVFVCGQRAPGIMQQAFDVLIQLFEQAKTKVRICSPGFIPMHVSQEACKGRKIPDDKSYLSAQSVHVDLCNSICGHLGATSDN